MTAASESGADRQHDGEYEHVLAGLETARDVLSEAYWGGNLDLAPSIIPTVQRLAGVYGVPEASLLHPRFTDDIHYDLKTFVEIPVAQTDVYRNLHGIRLVLRAFTHAAEPITGYSNRLHHEVQCQIIEALQELPLRVSERPRYDPRLYKVDEALRTTLFTDRQVAPAGMDTLEHDSLAYSLTLLPSFNHARSRESHELYAELYQVTRAIGSLRGVIQAMREASLTAHETVVLLKSFGYLITDRNDSAFCASCLLTPQTYLLALRSATKKLRRPGKADQLANNQQGILALTAAYKPDIMTDWRQNPHTPTACVVGLIQLRERKPQWFARYRLPDHVRAVITHAIEQVERTGIVDTSRLEAELGFKESTLRSIIQRTYDKMRLPRRMLHDSGRRIEVTSATHDVLSIPPATARERLKDDKRLLGLYTRIIQHQTGASATRLPHQRDIRMVRDALSGKSFDELIAGFARRRELSVPEARHTIEVALDQPVTVGVVARKLGVDRAQLHQWDRRLDDEGERLGPELHVTKRMIARRLNIAVRQVPDTLRQQIERVIVGEVELDALAEQLGITVPALEAWKVYLVKK